MVIEFVDKLSCVLYFIIFINDEGLIFIRIKKKVGFFNEYINYGL